MILNSIIISDLAFLSLISVVAYTPLLLPWDTQLRYGLNDLVHVGWLQKTSKELIKVY